MECSNMFTKNNFTTLKLCLIEPVLVVILPATQMLMKLN